MSSAQLQMKKALQHIVAPQLRARGFTGSLPHFRRRRPERIDLLTFQFDRHGGGFVIEIGQCLPEGFTTYWGKQIPPEKVRAWDLPPKGRARIKPRAGSGTDSWFRYDDAVTEEAFTRVAESVLPFLDSIETMLDDFDQAQRMG